MQDGKVGPDARDEWSHVDPAQRRRTATVADHNASAGVIRISRTASAMQNGIDVVKHEPGLQSLARATVTPASIKRRASGYGERVENATPGSSVATVPEDDRASMSAADR